MLTARGVVPAVVLDYAAGHVANAGSEGTLGPLAPDGDVGLYLLIQTDVRSYRTARWVKLWCIAHRPDPFRLFTLWIQTRERSFPGDDPIRLQINETISDDDWAALIETEIQLLRHSHIRVPQEKR